VGQTAAEYAQEVNKAQETVRVPPPPAESDGGAGGKEAPNPLELVMHEFFAAVAAGDVAKVFKMIQNGVHPDGTDKEGNTALVIAVSLGLNHVVEALIESGCNLNAANAAGETALALARRADASAVIKGEYHGHRKALVELLEAKGAGEDASAFTSIHTLKATLPSPHKPASADPLQLHATPSPERPATAAERPATAASAATTRPSTAATRPGSASKRPGTAKKFSTADLLKSASGLFSVFERSKAQEEVRRLEDDVRGVEKVRFQRVTTPALHSLPLACPCY